IRAFHVTGVQTCALPISREYGELVIEGELDDPTVSMQLHRGLEGRAIIEGYYPEWRAGDTAVLLVHEPKRLQRLRRPPRPLPGLREVGRLRPTGVRVAPG